MTTEIYTGTKTMVKDGQQVRHYDEGGDFIIHPLYDVPEEKVDTDNLGSLHLTGFSKWSLVFLRVYLVFGMLAVLYYVLQIATGVIAGH